MKRRAPEPEELDDDLDEAERGETEEPAPKARAKAAAASPAARATPEETREIDRRIFDAADRLEAKLGRPATQPEIAAAAKVPGLTETARRVRVSKAMRRRALLTEPAKKPSSGARPHKVQDAPIAPAAPSKPLRHVHDAPPRSSMVASRRATMPARRSRSATRASISVGATDMIGAVAFVVLVVLIVSALDDGPADRRRPW